MSKRALTPEEIEVWKAEKVETERKLGAAVIEGVLNWRSGGAFQRYLSKLAQLHGYSWRNTLLILHQCENATRVAGFIDWAKVGRYVRKGELGISIWRPNYYYRETTDERTGEVGRERVNNFTLTTVFDISQTDGEPLSTLPEWKPTTGNEGVEILERLIEWNNNRGVPCIKYDKPHSKGEPYGTYDHEKNEIRYYESAHITALTETMIHETAHSLDPVQKGDTTPKREAVAEGAACIVLSHFGIDNSETAYRYIGEWIGNKDAEKLLYSTLDRMTAASDTILKALVGLSIQQYTDTLPTPERFQKKETPKKGAVKGSLAA